MASKGVVEVTVCSGSARNNVAGLIHQIKEEMGDVVRDCDFKSLPYNVREMNQVNLSKIDVLLLCHSINNRRFSITDVEDALYDDFLPGARKYLGISKVGVIVHDLPEDDLTPQKLPDKMRWFRFKQKTTFENSSLALIGGQLKEAPVKLNPDQLSDLREFFVQAADPTDAEKYKVMLYRLFLPVKQLLQSCLALVCYWY